MDAHSRVRGLLQVHDAGAVLLLRGTRPRRVAPLRARRAHLHAFHESHSPVRGRVRTQTTGRSDWSRAVAGIPHGQGDSEYARVARVEQIQLLRVCPEAFPLKD